MPFCHYSLDNHGIDLVAVDGNVEVSTRIWLISSGAEAVLAQLARFDHVMASKSMAMIMILDQDS